MTTHGMRGTKIYTVWKNIKQRCNGTTGSRADVDYCARGIRYDPKWESFEGFYEDMGPAYVEGLEIDRIDNDDGYYKENCRWTTRRANINNRRNSAFVEHLGQRKTLAEWCDHLGLSRVMVYKRWNCYKIRDAERLFGPKTKPGVAVGEISRRGKK